MKRLPPFLLALAAVAATPPSGSIPLADARNINTPHPETEFAIPHYSSKIKWESRKRHLRAQILSAAGLLPMPERSSLNVRVVKTSPGDTYLIDTLLFEPFPGYTVGANLYRPRRVEGRHPAVVIAHGHWDRGRIEHRDDYSVPALGINLARQGYIALAFDMVGYNDTKQIPHSMTGDIEQLWSFTPLGIQTWTAIRAVDLLQSLPSVDPNRIAATGASGGGTQTFLLTAVDERIRASAPVNMISAHMQGGDACEEAPSLRADGAFNVEFAALAAPRPMLIVSSTRDWTKNTPEVEFPAIRRIYSLYGRESVVENVHIDAEHNYNRASRQAVSRFFAKVLRPPAPNFSDPTIELPNPESLLANLDAKDLPGRDELFNRWRRAAISQSRASPNRANLRAALGVEWPAKTITRVSSASGMLIGREGQGDRIPALWSPGKGAPVLAIHPDGAESAMRDDRVRALVELGRPVLAIDAFQTGDARANRYRGGKYFLSYNRTDSAHRVQDIVTAIAYLRSGNPARPLVIGIGEAAIWATFAAAVSPVAVTLDADTGKFEGTDEQMKERFFIPGIQRAGGWQAALALAYRAGAPRSE